MGNTFYFSFEPKLMIWLQSVLGENGSKAVGFFSEFGEAAFLLRALRYAVVIFVVTGIYPMIFGRFFKPQK